MTLSLSNAIPVASNPPPAAESNTDVRPDSNAQGAGDSNNFHQVLQQTSDGQQSNAQPVPKPNRTDKKSKADDADASINPTPGAVPVPATPQTQTPLIALTAFISFLNVQAPATDQPPAGSAKIATTNNVAITQAAIAQPVPTENGAPLVIPTANASAPPQPVAVPAVKQPGQVSDGNVQNPPAQWTVINPAPAAPDKTQQNNAAPASLPAGLPAAVSNAGNSTALSALQQASDNNPPTAQSPLSPNALAFAMRLNSANSQAVQPQVQTQSVTAVANTSESAVPTLAALTNGVSGMAAQLAAPQQQSDPNGKHSGEGSQGGFGQGYFEVGTTAARSSQDSTFTPTDQTSASRAMPADDPAAAAGANDPVKNLLLQLKSDDNRRIDVRVLDRGGELHISVKSADMQLAQRVQDHMPDLTSRLDAEHFSSEVWMPKLAESSRSENGTSSNLNQDGSAAQGNANSNGSGQRNGNHSQSRPDWVDLLENQIS